MGQRGWAQRGAHPAAPPAKSSGFPWMRAGGSVPGTAVGTWEHPHVPLNQEAARGLGDEQKVGPQGALMATAHCKYVVAIAHQ